MEVYNTNFEVEFKADKSPLTKADTTSHQIITTRLAELYPEIPIISEEGASVNYDDRKAWPLFWLVDPLDGTKEFIKRNGEFTVNIALIQDKRPVAGVIYAPASKRLYYAKKHAGAWIKEEGNTPKQIHTHDSHRKDGIIQIESRSHKSAQNPPHLAGKLKVGQTISMGSSLKFCLVAEGSADIYPRLAPTWEWDTAAGDAIVEEAGGFVVDANYHPLDYNKKEIKHKNFLVYACRSIMPPKAQNIYRHNTIVTRSSRERQGGHKSFILWFTGLSGSGKSTLAHAVEKRLHDIGCRTIVLDGDNIRHGLNKDLGFSKTDRRENIRRIGEVAKLFVEAGVIVLTAFISPFHEDRAKVRNLAEQGEFIETYCECSLETCEQRDTKGLFKMAREGKIAEFTGISSPYETPSQPELTVKTGELTLNDSVDQVIAYLYDKKYIL